MKVGEWFCEEQIDPQFINENFDGAYWESCEKFLTDKWYTDLKSLSPKQQSWLERIMDDCLEKRIEG